jgi:hypothetical protein
LADELILRVLGQGGSVNVVPNSNELVVWDGVLAVLRHRGAAGLGRVESAVEHAMQ